MRLPPPSSRAVWIGTAVALRLVSLFAFVSLLQADGDLAPGHWALEGGDSFSYVESVENLIRHGRYGYDLHHPPSWAGRMPGFSLLYLPLRLVLDRTGALNACVVIQAVLSGVAVYCLALLAWLISGRSASVFYLAYATGAVSTYVASWDYRPLAESPAAATLVLAVYLLVSAETDLRTWRLLGAGGLLAWSAFLKPALVPVILLGAVAAGYSEARGRRAAVKGMLVLLPFLALDAGWVARNYALLGRFVPFQFDENAGYVYSRSFLALVRLMKTWGADYVAWNPRAEIRWFDPYAGLLRRGPVPYEAPDPRLLPGYVLTSDCGLQELLRLRETYLRAHDPRYPEADQPGLRRDGGSSGRRVRCCVSVGEARHSSPLSR